jgi:hypothetical protein
MARPADFVTTTLKRVRPIRTAALVSFGAVVGFAGAAALVKRGLPSRGDESSDRLALVAIFDGVDLKSRATAFRGGSVLAWFCGVSIDLREAELAPGAHLSVNALLGGIAIRVPAGWRLESNLHAAAGGVDVRDGTEDPDAPTLTLDGFALLGGIAVGVKLPNEDKPPPSDT